jgi:benzoyl-CoA reductase/2-hydroxyglutaryl-CoA dehydratase subunit BcrC/BadD/HgdB
MRTLTLQVNEKIYDKLLWLLSKFSKDEVEILVESPTFDTEKKYLEKELNEIIKGDAKFFTVEETEERLEKIIRQHENPV